MKNCGCRRDYWSEHGYYVWSCLAHWWMCSCPEHDGDRTHGKAN